MTPADRAVAARELGLDEIPTPRGEVPEDTPGVPHEFRPSFWKAVSLIDRLETAAFEYFIPDICIVDQGIDTRTFKEDWSQLIYVRTDYAPPSNDRIHRLTGVLPSSHRDAMSPRNFYRYLSVTLAAHYQKMGAVAMGPPLVFRTLAPNKPKAWWNRIIPFLGAICKFDRTPADGRRMIDMLGDTGVLTPPRWTLTHALDE